jgi:hypothetical protein
VSAVQIRVNSVDGTPLTGISGPSGSADTGDWVSDGMTFYLQDASSGDSTGAAKTLDTVRVQVVGTGGSSNTGPKSGTISATPNPISVSSGQTGAATTLRWQTTGVTNVQIRVGSPSGTPLTGIEGPSGSAATGNWVTDGMTFYLQDASDGSSSGAAKTLASVRVQVTGSGGGSGVQSTLTATPNPIVLAAGQTTARTTLQWQARGASAVQLRVNSPTGSTLTGFVSPSGSLRTNSFVTDGMTFYLQDASNGSSAGASRTLATVQVRLISN